eukprot:scaffold3121_cov211-Skeletonema_marinoi.AAC.4
MKDSHVNKNSAAVIRKPASAKSSKVPFAKAAKSSGGGGDEGPLSLYEFADEGYCADSQAPQTSDILPYVYFEGSGSSPSDCASKCTECVSVNGAVSNGSFRGFALDYDCGICSCHVDVGSTYNPGEGCTDTDGIYSDAGGILAGMGEILGVYDGVNAVCYKSKLPEE